MPETPPSLTRTHRLEGGPPVRLRLARRGDEPELAALLSDRGLAARELELRRLLEFDPAERVVLCAVAPDGAREHVVGLGAIELRGRAEVDTLVVDERRNPGLGELLGSVLRAQAQARARRAA